MTSIGQFLTTFISIWTYLIWTWDLDLRLPHSEWTPQYNSSIARQYYLYFMHRSNIYEYYTQLWEGAGISSVGRGDLQSCSHRACICCIYVHVFSETLPWLEWLRKGVPGPPRGFWGRGKSWYNRNKQRYTNKCLKLIACCSLEFYTSRSLAVLNFICTMCLFSSVSSG